MGRRAKSYVVDFTHLEPVLDTHDEHQRPARRLASYFATIIQATTALQLPGLLVPSAVRCHCRPGHRPCPGYIEVLLDPGGDGLHFECPRCGEQGHISHFAGTRWDLSCPLDLDVYDTVAVTLEPEQHEALLRLELGDRDATRIVMGAMPVEDGLLLELSPDEVDLLVASLVVAPASSRVRARLVPVLAAVVQALLERGSFAEGPQPSGDPS